MPDGVNLNSYLGKVVDQKTEKTEYGPHGENQELKETTVFEYGTQTTTYMNGKEQKTSTIFNEGQKLDVDFGEKKTGASFGTKEYNPVDFYDTKDAYIEVVRDKDNQDNIIEITTHKK